VSIGSEPDTRDLIRRALRDGKIVSVPKCFPGWVMEARRICGLDELAPGRHGLPEPPEESLSFKKEEIDLAIVPCLGCDHHGHRLGYGGGYYDRWLADFDGTSVILCFEHLTMPGLPKEPHDVKADIVITDTGIFRTDTYRGL